jgi:uncharacterized protein
MPAKFHELTSTNSVQAARKHYYGNSPAIACATAQEILTADEIDFIQRRDSFYLATVNEAGWPYLQHRGGRPGFLQVVSPSSLAFADYRGNRQLLSTGNLAANDRVALFLMDYPRRQRLKILGHARTVDARQHPELVAQVAKPEMSRTTERVFFIEVISFDWNCPQYVTPRFTAEEIQELVDPLRKRIAELEAILTRQF